jgi:hypothetical protein
VYRSAGGTYRLSNSNLIIAYVTATIYLNRSLPLLNEMCIVISNVLTSSLYIELKSQRGTVRTRQLGSSNARSNETFRSIGHNFNGMTETKRIGVGMPCATCRESTCIGRERKAPRHLMPSYFGIAFTFFE